MKIAIDCSKAVNEQAGIARYTWEIASHLPNLYPHDQFFYFFNFIRGKKEKNKLIEKIIGDNKNIKTKFFPLPGQMKEFLFPSSFSLLNFWIKGNNIYHATEFLSFDKKLKLPQILTVHDLTMLKFPDHRGQDISNHHAKMLESACKNADKIIAVSESTKKDIIKYFPISADKIKVIHLGFDRKFKPIKDQTKTKSVLSKYKINFPFILFVGTIEPRKNIKNLMLAFAEFAKSEIGKKYHLILIGKRGWNVAKIDQIYQELLIKDKIHFLHYVDDKDLVYFYNTADLFCYPSIYEGFGLPPLEAMACGCPIVTANISSLPEVVGDAGILIDPTNVAAITNAMKKITHNPVVINEMKEKSIKQANQFSWEKCAKQTYEIYQEVYKT